MKRKPKSDQTKTYSTPIGDYRKGARNFGWWMLIYSLASLATFIVWVLYVHNEQRWFVITPATISIAVIWLAVAILVIAGFSTVEAGYVGVVTSFKRYVGTVNSGLFFAVRGINEYFEVFLGEQINELHMTNEKGKGSGAVELTDHVSIGVEATVWYKVVKEGAHLALFNTADFVTFINREMDSLLRSFLSCYSFQEINTLKGRSVMLLLFANGFMNPDGSIKPFKELVFNYSEEERDEILRAAPIWQKILQRWGIEILDLAIADFILPPEMEAAWNAEFEAEQQKIAAKTNAEKAVFEKQRMITLAEGERGQLFERGQGYADQIHAAMAASGASGEHAINFLIKKDKYAAVAAGANAILSDEGDHSGTVVEGARFGAGVGLYENRNQNPNNSMPSPSGIPMKGKTNEASQKSGGKDAGTTGAGKGPGGEPSK